MGGGYCHEVPDAQPVDLVVAGAEVVVTMDRASTDRASTDRAGEVPGGWVAVRNGLVVGVGPAGTEPAAVRTIRADNCVVTPGLVNAHHHIYQNLTRSFAPAVRAGLFDWLRALYPTGRASTRRRSIFRPSSAWPSWHWVVARRPPTTFTSTPRAAGDLLGAEIAAAREIGVRFHPTRGSMSVSEKDGGLPPDSVCQDEDTILAACEAAVSAHHDRSVGAMVRIALAPCSPFSVSRRLMSETAELAARLDVRLHTHLAEGPDEESYCQEIYGCRPVELFEDVGWLSDRSWIAHCVHPNAAEIERLGQARVGVAHCPSSNLLLGVGLAPVAELLAAGAPVGLGCDGSASTDSASLWLEARTAMLLARHRSGAAATGAREALQLATLGGAACLGRQGELGVLRPGAVGDLVCWRVDGPRFAGALSDPVEALLRCGPVAAYHTVVAGKAVVENGEIVHGALEDRLQRHRAASARIQRTGPA